MLAYQPMAQADWRDWITRENMTNMIWSKYGALGGTFVIMAMAAGLWGKSIWNAIRTPSNQNVDPWFQESPTVTTVKQLDTIYAEQKIWPNLKNFHTFIESIVGLPYRETESPQLAWIELVRIPADTHNVNKLLNTSNKNNFAWQFCYVLFKEHEIINALIKLDPQSKILTEVPKLIQTLIPPFTEDLVKKIEHDASSNGTIKQCVTLLNILYAIQRWPKNFYTTIRQQALSSGISSIQNQNDLLQLLANKNPKVHASLIVEKNTISTAAQFINQADKAVILSILDQLIKLTKPEKTS